MLQQYVMEGVLRFHDFKNPIQLLYTQVEYELMCTIQLNDLPQYIAQNAKFYFPINQTI